MDFAGILGMALTPTKLGQVQIEDTTYLQERIVDMLRNPFKTWNEK